ncbi:MAG: hypothetical protein AB7N76_29580 [Planctomycetota bacterium]
MKRLTLFVPGLLCGLVLGAALSQTPRARAQDAPELRTKLTTSVGALGAFGAYSCAQYLGALGEDAKHKISPTVRLRTHLGGLAGGLRSAIDDLTGLAKSVPEGERESVSSLATCYRRLLAEAQALDAYLEKPSPEAAETFRAARKAAWETTAKELGLEGEVVQKLEPGGATLGQ